MIGRDWALYGTARGGIDCPAEPDLGCGLVFRLAPPDEIVSRWRYQVLYRFKGGRDGANPVGQLAVDRAGNIYGVTSEGGDGCPVLTNGCGVIYKLTPPSEPDESWTRTILHRFQASPVSGVLLKGGALYGLAGASLYQLKL